MHSQIQQKSKAYKIAKREQTIILGWGENFKFIFQIGIGNLGSVTVDLFTWITFCKIFCIYVYIFQILDLCD